jgi:hypothetical protein
LKIKIFEAFFPEQHLQQAIEILIAFYDKNVKKMVCSNIFKLFQPIWSSLPSSSSNKKHKIGDTNGLFMYGYACYLIVLLYTHVIYCMYASCHYDRSLKIVVSRN